MSIQNISVGKILKDEKINIFAMTYGITESDSLRHQIFLCKKREIEEGPFLLYPKKSPPRFRMSKTGIEYSKNIEPAPFDPMFIGAGVKAGHFDRSESRPALPV